ncbi:MAG: hypothetical protein SGILL_004312, partial [Bacillariaceae sp.]
MVVAFNGSLLIHLVCVVLCAGSTSPYLGVSAFASATDPSSLSAARNMVTSSMLSDKKAIDQDVNDFHQFAAAAVDLTHVSVNEHGMLTAVRSCRNWDLDQRQSYLYRFSLKHPETFAHIPPTPLDASVKLYLPSPSGRKMIILKTTGEGNDETTILEVWEGAALVRRIPISKEQQHGKIVNDATGFGTPVWSPDETCLLYSAERVPVETEPFWKTKSGSDAKNDDTARRGGQSALGLGQREHWGERYPTLGPILDLFIVNLDTGRIGKVHNVPKSYPGRDASEDHDETIALGQAVWHPSGDKIAFTGWDAGLPKRLGMVYCRNRYSKVFEASVQKLLWSLESETSDGRGEKDNETYLCLTKDLPYSRSPRYVSMENGDSALVFLGNHREFVSHDSSMGLWHVTRKGEIDNIVPIIDMPLQNGPTVLGMGFPGLFLGQLPINCDLGNSNNYMITTTLFGSVQRIVRIDVSNGDIDLIEIPELDELSSQTVSTLAANGDLVLSVTSSNKPPNLWTVPAKSLQEKAMDGKVVVLAQKIATFDSIASSTFASVSKNAKVPFDLQILSVDPPKIDGATTEPLQAILLLPKDVPTGEKVPLVVVPHGGPHSCTTSAFVPGFANLASKYAVVFPNYRGSIGFGQAPMDSLLTRIGNVDVEDVMACTKHVIDRFSVIDGHRVGIC